MKRLRDWEDGGKLGRRVRDALRAVEASGEVSGTAEIRQLLQREPLPSASGHRLSLLAVAAVVLVAAGAAAQGGAGGFERWWSRTPEPGASSGSPGVAPPKGAKAAVAKAEEPAGETPGANPSVALEEAASGVVGMASASGRTMTAPREPRHPKSDAVLVHSALKALRRDGDPERATRLLERYASETPTGPLAEEALALRIEAALARRAPVTCALAREYLATYPQGRYRTVAWQALKQQFCP